MAKKCEHKVIKVSVECPDCGAGVGKYITTLELVNSVIPDVVLKGAVMELWNKFKRLLDGKRD